MSVLECGTINAISGYISINDLSLWMMNYDSFNTTNQLYNNAHNNYLVDDYSASQFFLILEPQLRFESLFCGVYTVIHWSLSDTGQSVKILFRGQF